MRGKKGSSSLEAKMISVEPKNWDLFDYIARVKMSSRSELIREFIQKTINENPDLINGYRNSNSI